MTTHPQTPTRPRQTLRGMGELIAYIPYLLDFHPTDSVVVLGSSPTGVGPTSRIDVVDEPAEQRAMIDLVLGQMSRAAPDWFDVVLFGDTPRGRAVARDVASRLRSRCGPVHHLSVVRPGSADRDARWQLASCRCGRSCRTRWDDVPDHDRIPAVADRVLAGQVPARDRAELVASLRPRPLVSRAVLAADEPPLDPARYAGSLLRVLDTGGDATPVEQLPVGVLADVLDGLAALEVRDHLLGWLLPHLMGGLQVRPDLTFALRFAGGEPYVAPLGDAARAVQVQERLRALVTCAPEPLVPAPATILAAWCWAHGGGALATIALQRALDARPDYRLAGLLTEVVQHGLRPDDLTEGRDAAG
jgi:Domain of unknown function (DUF4192)